MCQTIWQCILLSMLTVYLCYTFVCFSWERREEKMKSSSSSLSSSSYSSSSSSDEKAKREEKMKKIQEVKKEKKVEERDEIGEEEKEEDKEIGRTKSISACRFDAPSSPPSACRQHPPALPGVVAEWWLHRRSWTRYVGLIFCYMSSIANVYLLTS